MDYFCRFLARVFGLVLVFYSNCLAASDEGKSFFIMAEAVVNIFSYQHYTDSNRFATAKHFTWFGQLCHYALSSGGTGTVRSHKRIS